MKELTEQEALHKAAAYCSVAEHCCSEVMKKLQAWGVEQEAAERIVVRLIEEKFIDESRFAASFARDKFRFSKWGRVKIACEMRMRSLSREDIDSGLAAIDETEYLEVLEKLVRAKAATVKAKDRYDLYGKLMRYATGKGYEPNLASRFIQAPDDDF